jgi:hypothetical protein
MGRLEATRVDPNTITVTLPNLERSNLTFVRRNGKWRMKNDKPPTIAQRMIMAASAAAFNEQEEV